MIDSLTNDLRRLVEHAAAGGADRRWLAGVSDRIIEALVQLDQHDDPRPRETLEKARRIRKAFDAMGSMLINEKVAALSEQFRCSRKTVYRLLRRDTTR